MTKLILSLDGMVLREIVLDREKITIGRKPHNDVQIDNLAVSGEHAVVTSIHQDSFLEDLHSTNGTMVNGQPIQKHFLQDGDLIEIGKYKLKYVRDAAHKGPVQEDFEKTMVIRPGAVKPSVPLPAESTPIHAPTVSQPFRPDDTTIEPITQPVAPAAPAEVKPGVIKVLSGSNAGKSLDLTKNMTSLGKPGVQVAIITRRPTGYFLTHVEGPSRPLVNGAQIGVQAHALNDKDVIELAGVKMEFSFK